ncbi:DNA-directed RNA polymerase subunit alpha [bacterium]|nr:DNA-directed RNA polymerase subunit alpha [bacterium]NBX98360.1 DNA-directed RNA polymerase subunit alpha [bacterium]NDC93736.1 DNA-directed RNA polymerase subunit alpha [bacterium]NDD82877.1 DNA-directed RNA polymerase subunit alpha [bacterium]NDG28672.1 DNA-directed RNA polymerase subunit alpha [bacterium]
MSNIIHTPMLSGVTDHSTTSATFVIEPLHSGYGMTLGNSLRRVLLSSIAGAAITSFRIDGVSHEFTTAEGIKEDVVEIMQNLKGIRFRVFSDEPQTLRITKKGKGAITAKDISTNADVEVVNQDHVIAHIDNDKVSIIIDIIVEKGRGYRTIDDAANKRSSDMIALDAIFSPVLRVRYKVENTRVGQMTDLDKLLLTIDTDGSITSRDAFEEAAAILVNQYTALAGQTRVEVGAPLSAGKAEAAVTAESVDEPSMLDTSIEDLNLSARTTNALINNDIHTLKDLFSLSDAELRDLKGFGSKALDEVKEKMAELEL